MNKRVEILPDLQGLVARAQDAILSSLATAIQERGQFTIALSGGSTPKPLYEAIGSLNLDWDKIHVFGVMNVMYHPITLIVMN